MGQGQPVFNQVLVSSATPTLTGAAFGSGDAIGGKLTFSNVVIDGENCGFIEAVTLLDLSKQGIACDLVLFTADFTPTADNSPFDPSDADMANYLCHVNIVAGSYSAFNDNSAATVQGLRIPFKLPAGTTTLYGQLVARGTPTYVAGEVVVRIHTTC